ncbi:eukaryotic type KH-domain (KH-domain type I) [Nemania sp. FL0916]|nr:eukaryotic type KH-domain (KH-domain type I) [Nemania sp. FL0916]
MTSEQIDAYVLHVRIEEITQKLRIDNVVPADRNRRSPSPEPQYDASGKRINMRHQRYRRRLEEERHSLISMAASIIPGYRPPLDYAPRCRSGATVQEKVYIPNKEFPEINFIGQLLGPRGRSLTDLKTQSGANIVLRGKGSVKEGRTRGEGRGRGRARGLGRFEGDFDQDHEPLHCLITADTREKVEKAKSMVQCVIETIILTPEHANDRKRQQLRDLAVANGTFRDDENRVLRGSDGPRELIANIRCNICGGGGHISRDCPRRTAGDPWKKPPWRENSIGQSEQDGDWLEIEYQRLLASL